MENPLRWNDEQGRAYEQAREVMNNYLGMVHGEIYAEEEAAAPRAALLQALGQHAIDVTQERDNLNIIDDQQIAAVTTKYSALVRAMIEPTSIAA